MTGKNLRARTAAVVALVIAGAGLVFAQPTRGQGPAPEVAVVGRLKDKGITESSGLVASRRQPGILYTHNDSGGEPVVFAIKPDGALVRAYRVPAKHNDWEDIAIDDAGRLYVANTGNNQAKRETVEVFRVAEPDVSGGPGGGGGKEGKAKKGGGRKGESRLRVERSWTVRFPGRPFDCESLFIHGPHAYLVSKSEIGERAAIYRFPIEGAPADVTLEKVADLSVRRPVTGADVSPDGKRLALVSSGEGASLYLYAIGGDVAAAGKAEPRRVALPPVKVEGVAFTADGILMTAESREVYQYREGAEAGSR
jgi:hypothetical protein